jgi:hypothetical protein
MKILYLSVHEILEYDELLLFSELGYECYSLGAYTQPGGDEHRKRPSLKLPYDPHFIELALQYPKEHLHPEQLDGMDVVIVMHEPGIIEGNWELFEQFIKRGGRVIWRSIGQSIPHVEQRLRYYRARGMEIVRYSPREATIAGYNGSDAMIRFYKDPDEFKGWSGEHRQVINFTQSLKSRGGFTGYPVISEVFENQPGKVYGPGNEDLGLMAGGLLTYEDQKRKLQEARVYLSRLGNSSMFSSQQTYEVHELIENGVSGFIGDNIMDIKQRVNELLNDYPKAKAISAFGRAKAIELFGKSKIKAQWHDFLEPRK